MKIKKLLAYHEKLTKKFEALNRFNQVLECGEFVTLITGNNVDGNRSVKLGKEDISELIYPLLALQEEAYDELTEVQAKLKTIDQIISGDFAIKLEDKCQS